MPARLCLLHLFASPVTHRPDQQLANVLFCHYARWEHWMTICFPAQPSLVKGGAGHLQACVCIQVQINR